MLLIKLAVMFWVLSAISGVFGFSNQMKKMR